MVEQVDGANLIAIGRDEVGVVVHIAKAVGNQIYANVHVTAFLSLLCVGASALSPAFEFVGDEVTKDWCDSYRRKRLTVGNVTVDMPLRFAVLCAAPNYLNDLFFTLVDQSIS